MHELELRHSRDKDGVDLLLGHQRRDLMWRRRSVDDFLGQRVGDVVLDASVLAGGRSVAADAADESLVDLPYEPFRDRITTPEIIGHQVERLAVVDNLLCIIGANAGWFLSSQQSLRLVESEVRPFDVRGVVGLERSEEHTSELQSR